MGTESQNNSYYGGHSSSPGPTSAAAYNSYLQQYQNHQPPQEPNRSSSNNNNNNNPMTEHGLRALPSAPTRSNSFNNQNWTPMSSSSSSDNSSPSSSSGNYFQEMNRNQSNSNYYLQNFCAMGQQKGNWDFMHNAQKQVPYNNFEYNAHNGSVNETGGGGGATNGSSSTSNSSSSSSSSSQGNNSFTGQHTEKRTPHSGSSGDQAAGYHPYQHQAHLQTQHHYANTLHYRHQQMLQIAAGSLKHFILVGVQNRL